MEIHKSAEDYLEKILMIQRKNGIVKSIDIAKGLEFSKASVSVAMKKLKESNYIVIDKNGDIKLTNKGLEVATKIYERHEVLASVFMKLGVDEKTAYEDACKVEHDLSDETFEALKKYIKDQKEKNGMDLKELSLKRHSIRHYKDEKIPEELVKKIEEKVKEVNAKSNLDIQVVLNEKEAMAGFEPRLTGAVNYLSFVGKKDDLKLEEKVGYYGEELVLFLTGLGLGTLWVAGSLHVDKVVYKANDDETLVLIVAFGFASDNGNPHETKPLNELSNIKDNSPKWFLEGMEEVSLAPSAMHRQNFYFTYVDENRVEVNAIPSNPPRWAKVDRGIAIYHFEIGSSKKVIEL